MIKQLFILVAAAAMFASCSSKIELLKRKYNKGYYVSVLKKHKGTVAQNSKNQTAAAKLSPQTKPHTEKVVVAKATDLYVHESREHGAVPSANVKASSTETGPKQEAKVTASAHLNKRTENTNVKALEPILKQKGLFYMNGKRKGSSADTNTILLVILCLFPLLALVAIYLKEGKKITTNFWIDLILHFVALYWLFAILVVLDVFSFS